MDGKSCVTFLLCDPGCHGTSNELDVQNKWEENTHTHILTLILHLGPYINYRVNITQHKPHMSMRILSLSAVCIERLNTLQPKQPCWSEGYLKPKPGTYCCHLPDVCRLCVLWSLSLLLQSVPRCNKKVALYV